MEQTTKSSTIIASGLALFSMFFGAGNVIFPLALGQFAQDKTFYAILGLLITAVGVPLIGVVAMALYDGHYKAFFARIGKTPGFILAVVMMGLIGPFGALPRCIALSFSTMKMYVPTISLPLFSLASCLIIFLFTFKKNKILDLLAYVLTPFLLLSLGIIIVMGFIASSPAPAADHTSITSFLHGLNEGYQTMDLLGAFFFSGVVIIGLKEDPSLKGENNDKQLIKVCLKAGLIGSFLLGLIYVGFSYVAAFNSELLADFGPDELLGALALKLLGPNAAIVAIIAVALACLTTAIALAAVFAEFLCKEVCNDKINYLTSLIITLVVSYFISTLEFTGIAAFLVPILQVCYPALIMLCLVNIAHKLYHFNSVVIPVAAVFVVSLVNYLMSLG